MNIQLVAPDMDDLESGEPRVAFYTRPLRVDVTLEQYLVHVFKTEGIDFGDGDYCSIVEAVEGVDQPRWEAMEKTIDETMPSVVVALVRERNAARAEWFGEERLLALAKLCMEVTHPSPRAAVEAIEAALAVLKS
jgi:hypothetical protein